MGALRELELSKTDYSARGLNDASLNGFTNGVDNTTVTLNNPPLSGTYAGDTQAVEAVVTRSFPTFFMMVFGQQNVTIAARAVGRTATTEGTIGGCIFALNKSMKSALKINGTSMSLNTSCSAIDESTDASAFTMGSGVSFNLANHAHVGVVGPGATPGKPGSGGWSIVGQAALMDLTHSPSIIENPVNIADPGDPLQNVKAPTLADVTGGIQSSSPLNYSKNSMPPGNKLYPGIYCGGITINDTNNAAIMFQPGIYVMAGGGFTINSSGVVKGAGVMFYNTTSTGWGCSSSYSAGPLKLDGQSQVTFSAPTSGFGSSSVGAAMLFFEDRSLSGLNNNIVGGSGCNTCTFDGAMYFKNSALSFAGNNTANGYMVLVADSISINGASTLGSNYTSLSNPNPLSPSSTGGGLVQ
jgi:hypothetical protein